MLSFKQSSMKYHFFESLVWLDQRLNPGLPTTLTIMPMSVSERNSAIRDRTCELQLRSQTVLTLFVLDRNTWYLKNLCKSFLEIFESVSVIWWSVCMSKSHTSSCVLFSRTGAGLCIFHLFVWSNLNFLYISQWITLPTQSCLVLYFFCTNLLYSFIMCLMVSPHSLHFPVLLRLIYSRFGYYYCCY